MIQCNVVKRGINSAHAVILPMSSPSLYLQASMHSVEIAHGEVEMCWMSSSVRKFDEDPSSWSVLD